MSAVEEQMLSLIGGEFVGAASDETLDVIEPATGAVLASVPAGWGRGCRPRGGRRSRGSA